MRIAFILNLAIYIALVFPTSPAYADINNGLVAHYGLDETSGPIIDSTGSNNGTNNGATQGVPGRFGNAYRFNGSTSYIDTLPTTVLSTVKTISLWIKPESQGQIYGSISNASGGKDGFFFHHYEDINRVRATYSLGNSDRLDISTGESTVPLNEWSHVVVVYDTTEARIYVNGLLEASGSLSTSTSVHDRTLMFGKAILSQNNGYDGLMDEIMIWNRVLDEDEIASLSNQLPIADAGDNVSVECAGEFTAVQLDGTQSSDPDGDPLSFSWSVPEGSSAIIDDSTSPTPIGLFPVGPTLMTLTVSDGLGGLDVADVLVTVTDTSPPVLVCTTDKAVLWPPNHRMRDVWICLQVSDECSNPDDLTISCTVSSNQPDDANGDGNFTGDVDGLDGFIAPVPVELVYDEVDDRYYGLVSLRAERDGKRKGRKYSFVCTVEDASGNESTASCVVVVPKKRKRRCRVRNR